MSFLVKRTTQLMKVSEGTLYEWVSAKEEAGSVYTEEAFGRKKSNEIPTVAKLMRHFEGDSQLPSVSTATMPRMVEKLRFRCKKRSRNALLIEATHIVQIAVLRGYVRQVPYAYETWVNAEHTNIEVWVDETVDPLHKARRYGLSTVLQYPRG
ncbi:hypothetical protein HPB49_005045 [Dermacentor silvarum]|uniref:Uncharacterized protein n=1 Tax=Dermacentor silvarum TaxID=543639 RepID=A0ACB8CVI4_DERSI|nr:hypothetical protein HPB49_005045 [Dermacentor silvarum]